MTTAAAAGLRGGRARRGRARSEAIPFLLPAAAMSLGLIALPLAGLLTASLFDWRLTAPDQVRFVGLSNYARLAADPALWRALAVTALFVVESVVLQLAAGVAIALLFNHRLPGLGLVRTLFLAPMMIAPVFAGMIWRLFLSDDFGVVKYALLRAGMEEVPLWLGDPALAIHVVVLISAWQWIPFVVLFVLAGLQVIPSELLEAARLDGAGPLARLRHVVLPLLAPILATVAIFRVIDAVKVFDLIYATTAGGPGDSTQTLSYLVYQVGMTFFDVGYGSALAVVMLAVVALMALGLVAWNSRVLAGQGR